MPRHDLLLTSFPLRYLRSSTVRLTVLLGLTVLWVGATASAVEARRIVAIGDIHGAGDALVEILQETQLIDEKRRWIGGDAVFVQTGDFLDRGAAAIEVADLLMELQDQAPASGGQVVVLLGNHEILNLLGDLRDVTSEILDPFIDQRSEARRAFLCKAFVRLEKQRAKVNRQSTPSGPSLRRACLKRHPLGLIEYREALGPEGRLGGWLRSLPAVARVDRIVFLHGGLSPGLALDIETINLQVREELAYFDQVRGWLKERQRLLPTSSLREQWRAVRELVDAQEVPRDGKAPDFDKMLQVDDWLTVRADGPFWFREYAYWEEEEGRIQVADILADLEADHLVVGHTPQRSTKIEARFDNRVFLIDTGMLASVYRGRPAALEIHEGRFTAVYPQQRQILREPLDHHLYPSGNPGS